MRFHFTNSKLSEKHFSTEMLIEKYQISKSKGAKAPSALPLRRPLLLIEDYVYCTFVTLVIELIPYIHPTATHSQKDIHRSVMPLAE